MQPLSAAELAAMQATQESAMFDTCVVQAYSESVNAYGEPIGGWTDGAAQACGVHMTGGLERHTADNTAVNIDATLRLPVGTTVDLRSRVKVTHRHGVAITPAVYEIVGPVRRGPSGVQIDLRAVST